MSEPSTIVPQCFRVFKVFFMLKSLSNFPFDKFGATYLILYRSCNLPCCRFLWILFVSICLRQTVDLHFNFEYHILRVPSWPGLFWPTFVPKSLPKMRLASKLRRKYDTDELYCFSFHFYSQSHRPYGKLQINSYLR